MGGPSAVGSREARTARLRLVRPETGNRQMIASPGFRLPEWAAGSVAPCVLAPFRPLPPAAAAFVLDVLEVGPSDWFADFGCGAGGVLQLAQPRGCRLLGVEIDGSLASAAAACCPTADVLHEPIGWTPPIGPTCGLFHQLPWALPSFLLSSGPYLLPGFRLAVPIPPDAASLRAATGTGLPAPSAQHLLTVDDASFRILVHTSFPRSQT